MLKKNLENFILVHLNSRFSQLNGREFDLKTFRITVIHIRELGEGVSKASRGEHCDGYLGVSIVPN